MPHVFRTLYVEDNPYDADLTKAHFETHHPEFELELARSGAECLGRLQERHYDVLLLDHHLPDMSGLDVLKQLAARPLMVPVVMTTGVGDEALAVQALRLGACDYVPKQGDYIARLPDILKNAIAEGRTEREPRHAGGRARRRILYVERNRADIDLTVRHFAEAAPNLEVQAASSAGEALSLLSAGHYDLLLVDLRMPDMSALELLQETRRHGLRIPFVVITGGGDEAAAVAALKLGAYDYIVKTNSYLTRLPYAIENALARFQLAQQATALAEAAREKDDFLAMLSHELRNPLAPIRTALDLLRRAGPRDDVSASAHEVIDRQVTHMVRLLDDLLDVARITRGRITLDIEKLDLRRVVKDAIDSVRNYIDARRHHLEVVLPEAPVFVPGDATRLVQVMVNLLNNAAKYTREGGSIRVTLAQEPPHAVLRVADTGAGIAPRLLPRIFDLFTQDDRTLDRALGGLGLGLTLARRITELHDGTIEAHSAGPGRGSEFVVRLPLHVDEQAAGRDADARRAPSRRARRLLVVEDNVDAARMLEMALQMEGHDVRLAFDGRDAVGAAAAFQPDVVILDIGLPRMTGYDAARAIRQLPGLADVFIVALTGYGQAADHEKSREAGIDQHLVKPVDLDLLLETLAEAPGRPTAGNRQS